MSDENTHVLNLIAVRNQNLEKENLRLKKELEASKKILFRMDRKREGLFRMVNHLRNAWEPENKQDEKAVGMKKDIDTFHSELAKSIVNVSSDPNYCQKKDAALEAEIESEAAVEVKKEEEFAQKLIADKWKRKGKGG